MENNDVVTYYVISFAQIIVLYLIAKQNRTNCVWVCVCLFVCVCVCACVRACVRACVDVDWSAVHVCVSVLSMICLLYRCVLWVCDTKWWYILIRRQLDCQYISPLFLCLVQCSSWSFLMDWCLPTVCALTNSLSHCSMCLRSELLLT